MNTNTKELAPSRRASDRPRGKLRKGMYILPSLFTTANIAAGFYAILQTVHGSTGEAWHMDFAAMAIGLPYCLMVWTAASHA